MIGGLHQIKINGAPVNSVLLHSSPKVQAEYHVASLIQSLFKFMGKKYPLFLADFESVPVSELSSFELSEHFLVPVFLVEDSQPCRGQVI